MRAAFGTLFALSSMAFTPATATAAATPRGVPIATVCTGPIVAAGRTVAKDNDLKFGLTKGACFGKMRTYDEGTQFQYVVSAPSPACPKGRAIDVFAQARAGNWYSYFEKPVCGSALSIGPKNPWGDWMVTIDGRHYDSRGQYYILVP